MQYKGKFNRFSLIECILMEQNIMNTPHFAVISPERHGGQVIRCEWYLTTARESEESL